MRIGLDGTPLIVPTGGIVRYVRELSEALARHCPGDEVYLLSDQPLPAAPRGVRATEPAKGIVERRWWSVGVQWRMRQHRLQVFHGTDFAVPYLPLRPSVVTIHDLSPWMNREWHHDAARVRRRTPFVLGLRLPTMVITPSEVIRRQVLDAFRIHPSRVVAIPHAASPCFRPVQGPPAPRPYFLYVGTVEPRKNLPVLIEAWREVRRCYAVDLVIAGRLRRDAPPIQKIEGLRLLGPVPDEDLPELYSGSLACVYPSLYEGFGLPVLEAMQCGAAVIASRDPAIGEVAAGAVLQVDAHDVRQWKEVLLAAASNPESMQPWRDSALRRSAFFSWQRSAALTRQVYEEAVQRFGR
jgi:Glycosyltransferase